MKHSLPPLGDLEHELLSILWKRGEMTAFAVRKQVARKLKDTTIRTVLRRLEQKGYVEHEVEGRAFLYRPVEAPRSLAARAVRHILDRFCNGSVDELVSGLVEADVLSDAELATLEASIKARAGARIKRVKKGR